MSSLSIGSLFVVVCGIFTILYVNYTTKKEHSHKVN